MDTAFKKDIYEHLAPVWSGSFSRDFAAETIVPDAMPDVASVVDADGVITLRSKETEAGAVTLAASVSVWVMYVPEGGGPLQSLNMTLPAELRADAPGADTDCRTVARLRIRSLEARAVNSRKLSVRADVDCEASVYQHQSLILPSALEGGDGTVHILPASASMVTVADVREKTFVVTDEYQLPPGCGGVERLLSQRAEASVDDVKYASGKVVFRGRIRAGLIFAGAEGRVFAGRYETEWSQIMEVDVQDPDVTAEVALQFTGAYFDLPERQDGDGRVTAELHLVAQTVCRQSVQVGYIQDIYSNRTVLLGEREAISLVSAARAVSMRQTVTGSAEILGGAGEILALSASVGSVAVDGETVKTSVNIRLITAQEDGSYSSARCRLTAEFTTDLPAGTELINVSVTVAEVYAAGAGSGADVRAALQMDATAVTRSTLAAVTAARDDPEAYAALPPAPSATLARVEPGADMWAVAKKYRSTVEAIAAVNGEKRSGLLLIPKAR